MQTFQYKAADPLPPEAELDPAIVRWRRKTAFERAIQQRKSLRPDEWYSPHREGQVQFHQSTSPIRALFPGNGFGKTTAMAMEVHWWAMHCHRFQPTPPGPIRCMWFPKGEKQWQELREQVEAEVFGPLVKWQAGEGVYRWPDGSTMRVCYADRGKEWQAYMGVNPHLICMDEEKPLQLWREMLMRRRGRRDTRFILAATAVSGITWMYDEIYKLWLDYHERLEPPMGYEEALVAQKHPDLWVWDKGGIDSNPGATQSQRDWYHGRTWSSEKEKRVRLYGGFADWVGDAVFDDDGLERMRKAAADLHRLSPGPGNGLLLPLRLIPSAPRPELEAGANERPPKPFFQVGRRDPHRGRPG